MTKYNQEQFDKIFGQMALNETARDRIEKHERNWEDIEPIPTTVAYDCNNCGEEVDTNSVYYPSYNEMEWTCPHCGEEDSASNWHDYAGDGNLRHFDTGDLITPENIQKFYPQAKYKK